MSSSLPVARAATACLTAVVVVLTVTGLVLHQRTGSSALAAGVSDWWLMGVTGALAFGGTGAWVVWAQPRQVIGWLFVAMGAASAVSFATTELGLWSLSGPSRLPGTEALLWVGNWLWVTAILPVVAVVPLLVPDGRLPSARWRPALLAGLLSVVAGTMSFAFTSYAGTTPALAGIGLRNPVLVPVLDRPEVSALMTLLILTGPVLAVAGLIVRWRRSRGVQRQQLKWVLLGVATAIGCFALGFVLGPTASALAMLPLPLGVVVAVLRYRLWDVDVVISRSLVYAALMVCVVAVYVVVVGVLGGMAGRTTGAPILATALVAVAVEPVHRRLRALVNRVVHGTPEDPVTALAELGRRVAAAEDPETVADRLLPHLVSSAARSLHLAHVGVVLSDGTVVEHGQRGEQAEELPLGYAGAAVGSLVATPRAGGLDRSTRARLRQLADQVAVAAHSVLLASALRRSREEAVEVREEERRRLFNDLHDGLGPSLAALALTVEVARDALATDPDRTGALLDRALPRLRSTVAEVRSVVHGLRPPALDDLGLDGALRELAAGFTGPSLAVRLDCDEDLAGLPAATEVATYRIVAEALTNASRHAGASSVVVRVRRDGGQVSVDVEDDGRGLDPQGVAGLGLASMTGRAEEVGGRLGIGPGAHGRGTAVRAVLPVTAS